MYNDGHTRLSRSQESLIILEMKILNFTVLMVSVVMSSFISWSYPDNLLQQCVQTQSSPRPNGPSIRRIIIKGLAIGMLMIETVVVGSSMSTSAGRMIISVAGACAGSSVAESENETMVMGMFAGAFIHSLTHYLLVISPMFVKG